jgi:hypothetical protein
VVALAQLDADGAPIVVGGDIQYLNLSTDSARRPVCVIDFDLAIADHPGDNSEVPQRHVRARTETENAAGFRIGTSVIDAGRSRPPTPCIAE